MRYMLLAVFLVGCGAGPLEIDEGDDFLYSANLSEIVDGAPFTYSLDGRFAAVKVAADVPCAGTVTATMPVAPSGIYDVTACDGLWTFSYEALLGRLTVTVDGKPHRFPNRP